MYFLITICMGLEANPSRAQVQPIAFTYGRNALIHVTNGTTIQFNKVITDMSLAADFQTPAVFTSPAEGIYKFQVYSLTSIGTPIKLQIYRNQDLVSSLYGYTPNDFADAGNVVILHLNKGDVVFMKSYDNADDTLIGAPDAIYTTFSGVRLLSGAGTAKAFNKGIAFSTTLTSHRVFNPGSTILYDKLLLNEGNGYSINTGVFTAPVPGIYIFHFFSLSEKNEEIWQELYHNSDYVCAIYGLQSSLWADAGNTAILHLRSSDTVQIKSRGTSKLFGASDEIYSSFSGALISGKSPLYSGIPNMVAFSAGLSSNITVAMDSKVVFDRIFIDLHNAYDQHTGEFTAPIQGLYEFNVHAFGQSDQIILLELYHNYRYVVSLYSHTPSQYGAAGNAAVLELEAGDVVYVKAHQYQNSALFGADDQVHCTFSGHLIAPTHTVLPIIG